MDIILCYFAMNGQILPRNRFPNQQFTSQKKKTSCFYEVDPVTILANCSFIFIAFYLPQQLLKECGEWVCWSDFMTSLFLDVTLAAALQHPDLFA